MSDSDDVVTRFWTAIHTHDWDEIAAVISPDFVRVGMRDNDEDTCRGREAYLAFLAGVIGQMDHHELRTLRIFWSEDRRIAVSETIETIWADGQPSLAMRFANVQEIDENGLIARLDIYWKSPPRQPPEWTTVESVLDKED